MKPLGFLTGVVLGSSASIALVLAMVIVVFAFSAAGRAEIGHEFPAMLAAAGLFGALAGVAGAAFVGLARNRRWRWAAQAAMWIGIAAVGWYYWPEGN
jgi:hypothetical protein